MPRSIQAIANEIFRCWPNPYYAALPYLRAMCHLHDSKEYYGADSASSVVLYFLSNARTWRGLEARRLKAELKELIK